MRTSLLSLTSVGLGFLLVIALAGCSGESAQVPAASNRLPSPADPAAGNPNAAGPTTGAGVVDGPNNGGGGNGAIDGGVANEGPWPGSQVFFFNFPNQKQASGANWGTALTDIVRHLNPTYGTQYDYPSDRITWGQLTSHGISAHLRFAYNVTGKPANGFYVLQDRATLVVEPTMHISDIGPRIPVSLRGSRYQSYVVDAATDWNDSPTYVLEEWVGFTNGSEVAVDLVKQNLYGTQVRDGVGGTFELTMYALAFGLAAEQVDATYFTQNPLTREFLAWNIERAMRLYAEGSVMSVFANNAQDDYAAKWRSGGDAAPLRNFARRIFGGTYCTKVLGIAPAKE